MSSSELIYLLAFDTASQDFLLWLEPGDKIVVIERWKFGGLKHSVEEKDQRIAEGITIKSRADTLLLYN
ncbi:hypothetical protein A8L34_00045 [Bacillus sp. FJAT-27264]|uniref:hypothetical protein n=1 Tax=Paenibacillus sp. (strain DSM 101736 / FJAT-27264) TaxID=1850362 RepID=UPI0008080E66|nr:hypothetical protein [Bacillus sp. FJAT-27264]OBZ18021.1 hypothetical protein A8L34_00045 [Bacillus sp. FJAT-27264]